MARKAKHRRSIERSWAEWLEGRGQQYVADELQPRGAGDSIPWQPTRREWLGPPSDFGFPVEEC